MKTTLLGIASALLFAAAPAAAQQFPHWEAGPWQVDSDGTDCLLVYSGEDRQLAIVVANTDTAFYMQVIMPGTAEAPLGRRYALTVTLGSQRYVSEGRRLPDSKAMGTILEPPSTGLMAVVGRADKLGVTVDGIGTIAVPLDPVARSQFMKCEAAIGGVGSAPAAD